MITPEGALFCWTEGDIERIFAATAASPDAAARSAKDAMKDRGR
jgi:hypothetical protein